MSANPSQKNLKLLAQPALSPLCTKITVPGDKSISHRSLMFGAIAKGTSRIEGLLKAEDVKATQQALRQLGVDIQSESSTGHTIVQGVGLGGLTPSPEPLDLGNSGTGMRLLSGLLCGQHFASTLIGDASLSSRPMRRVVSPLQMMGASIQASGDSQRPPLYIEPVSGSLKAIHYDSPIASAQVKSCVLLAGLYADGSTSVIEPARSRDHSERMLQSMGCDVAVVNKTVTLTPGQQPVAAHFIVPGDISSAAFFIVAASLIPGSDLLLENIGVNPLRTGVIDILKAMGGKIDLCNQRVVGGEPIADIRVQAAKLHGIDVPTDMVPRAIDEFPVLFVAAALAEGQTTVSGAEELRAKESDRIDVMCQNLSKLGIDIQATPDGAVINGGSINSGEVDSQGDHRCAMAAAIAAAAGGKEILIDDCANVSTSFPEFTQVCQQAGITVQAV